MASYTTIEDWKDVEDGYVVDVTIRQTGTRSTLVGGTTVFTSGKSEGVQSSATTMHTNGRRVTNVILGIVSNTSSFPGC